MQHGCHADKFDISEALIDLLRQPRGEFWHACTVARDHLVTGVQSLGDKVACCFSQSHQFLYPAKPLIQVRA